MEVDKDDAIITSPDKKRTKVDKPRDDDSDDDDVSESIPPCVRLPCHSTPSACLDSLAGMIRQAGIALATVRPRP